MSKKTYSPATKARTLEQLAQLDRELTEVDIKAEQELAEKLEIKEYLDFMMGL